MKPPKDLLAALRRHDLVPAKVQVENEPWLQEIIRDHIGMDQAGVVWFDPECIDGPESYEFRADDFVDAMPDELSKPRAEVTRDGDTMTCRIKHGDEVLTRSWQQDSDWVSSEFLELIMQATRSEHGGFHEIKSGDQTFLAVYLDAETGKALLDYREKDAGSRAAFFTSTSEYAKRVYSDIKILRRTLYRETLAAFRERFMIGDDPRRIDAYKDGEALAACLVGKGRSALAIYEQTRRARLTLAAPFNEYEYAPICPEGPSHVLSLARPDREVIFAYDAERVCTLMGDQVRAMGPYLIVDQHLRWGVLIDDPQIIGVGEPVLGELKPLLHDIGLNQSAPLYRELDRHHIKPLLDRLGYVYERCGLHMVHARQHANHWSAIALARTQEHAQDPVILELLEGRFYPEVELALDPESTHPRDILDYALERVDGACYTLSPESDQAVIADAACQALAEIVERLARELSMQEWQDRYRRRNRTLQVAATALKMGDQDEAYSVAKAELDEMRAKDFGTRQFLEKAKRLGLKLE